MQLKAKMPVQILLNGKVVKVIKIPSVINEPENYPRKMKKAFKHFMIDFIYKSIGVKFK